MITLQVTKAEVDQPEAENYRPEDLHDYPPKIVCRFYPEESAQEKVIATVSLSGLQPDLEVSIMLLAPKRLVVDTSKLQVMSGSQCSHYTNIVLVGSCSLIEKHCPQY